MSMEPRASRESNAVSRKVVSCASDIKWLAWNAAWHSANVLARRDEAARVDLARFEHHYAAIAQKLPGDLVAHVRAIVWSACWHAANKNGEALRSHSAAMEGEGEDDENRAGGEHADEGGDEAAGGEDVDEGGDEEASGEEVCAAQDEAPNAAKDEAHKATAANDTLAQPSAQPASPSPLQSSGVAAHEPALIVAASVATIGAAVIPSGLQPPGSRTAVQSHRAPPPPESESEAELGGESSAAGHTEDEPSEDPEAESALSLGEVEDDDEEDDQDDDVLRHGEDEDDLELDAALAVELATAEDEPPLATPRKPLEATPLDAAASASLALDVHERPPPPTPPTPPGGMRLSDPTPGATPGEKRATRRSPTVSQSVNSPGPTAPTRRSPTVAELADASHGTDSEDMPEELRLPTHTPALKRDLSITRQLEADAEAERKRKRAAGGCAVTGATEAATPDVAEDEAIDEAEWIGGTAGQTSTTLPPSVATGSSSSTVPPSLATDASSSSSSADWSPRAVPSAIAPSASPAGSPSVSMPAGLHALGVPTETRKGLELSHAYSFPLQTALPPLAELNTLWGDGGLTGLSYFSQAEEEEEGEEEEGGEEGAWEDGEKEGEEGGGEGCEEGSGEENGGEENGGEEEVEEGGEEESEEGGEENEGEENEGEEDDEGGEDGEEEDGVEEGTEAEAEEAAVEYRRFEQHADELQRRLPAGLAHSLIYLVWSASWAAVHARSGDERLGRLHKERFEQHATALAAGGLLPRVGVNLGGWLICEAWMQETLFSSVPGAIDEFRLCQVLEREAIARHRASWITAADLAQIKRLGLTAVRVPFGYWLLDPPGPPIVRKPAPPYTGAREWLRTAHEYVGPAEHVISQCLDACAAAGLLVNLCLHGAPGGQSGEQACGFVDREWTPSMWDVEATVRCVEHAARLWGRHPALDALTVINEPSNEIPIETLVGFYEKAYHAARPHTQCSLVFPAYKRAWSDFEAAGFPMTYFENIVIDAHLYQCFGDAWQRETSLEESLENARTGEGHFPCLTHLPAPSCVSEWSLRLPVWDDKFPIAQVLAAKDEAAQHAIYRKLGRAQVMQFASRGASWYFWTWKVDAPSANRGAIIPGEPMWDLRECVRRQWLDPRWWGGELLDDGFGAGDVPAGDMHDEADADLADKMVLASEVSFSCRPPSARAITAEISEAIGALSLCSAPDAPVPASVQVKRPSSPPPAPTGDDEHASHI